ncbi:glycoside hydrolase family 2 protein [Flagellimonas sp.]|uniref:glycoside hydrolase family 2 protein n=1 Tax=Flagellimonas sp. TaxID=2058762 RepID=UPI003AB50C9B
MNHKFLYIGLSLVLGLCLSCQPNSHEGKTIKRKVTSINSDWSYLEKPYKDLDSLDMSAAWIAIDVPHTWNATDVVDQNPGYRRSSSWYRRSLNIDNASEDLVYELYFEGVNMTSEVYVNRQLATTHIGGYVGFKVDITPYLQEGSNELLVRVDNSYDPNIIPSQKSDFFLYGGITRDVWLTQKNKTHLKGLKVSTPTVSAEKAALELHATLANYSPGSNALAAIRLIDPTGSEVFRDSIPIKDGTLHYVKEYIEHPMLWDIESPNLYQVEVLFLKDGLERDRVTEKIGFRWFEFADHGPFFLNGKRVLLRGTHRHEESAGIGPALSNEQHRKDIEQVKAMGANFIRLGHYPQDPEVYRACDELGILVWDELPWCRGGLGGDLWKANTRNLLDEMILQNSNHPSIILWSLGNEIDWLPDFENGDNPDAINVFLEELNERAHALDPYRKTAIRKYYPGSHIVDVFSPSIWSGWYSGSYKSYEKALATYKKEYPHFIHAEYGGSSHLGRHAENPITGEGIIQSDGWEEAIVQTEVDNIAKIGDWSENYIVDLFDWHLRITEMDSTFVGNAQWAFKDFGTPLRPENDIPYVNQKGLMDREGNPKDAYYVFKSYWSDDPFVYIESPTWNVRQGPKGKTRTISVYSNCNTVTLSWNGRGLGPRTRDISKFPASGLNWEVEFVEGTNVLEAVGHTDNSKEVRHRIEVAYRHTKNGSAKSLALSHKRLDNGNYLVTATALDGKGLRCLDYSEKVYFQCLSGGNLSQNRGTPTGSSVIAMANGIASIEVQPEQGSEKLELVVFNQNFKGTYLTIPNP